MASITDYSGPPSLGTDLSAAGALVGGLGSLVGGFETAAADKLQAEGYAAEIGYLQQSEFLTGESGGLQALAAARQAQRAVGTETAAAGANGMVISGSVRDILTQTAREGALQQGVIALQTSINEASLQAQIAAAQYEEKAAVKAASGAETSGIFGALGGVLKAGGLIAGIF